MNSFCATILILVVVVFTSRNFIINVTWGNLKDIFSFRLPSIRANLDPKLVGECGKVVYSSIIIYGLVIFLSVWFITSFISNECYEEDEKTKYSKSFRQFENYAFDRQRNNQLMNRYR